jgi:hypothetical protein
MSKFEEHIRGLLSIYEGKTPIIVLLAIAFSIIAMWQAIRLHNIDTNLTVIVLSLVGTVAGVNVSAVVQKMDISSISNMGEAPVTAPVSQPSIITLKVLK